VVAPRQPSWPPMWPGYPYRAITSAGRIVNSSIDILAVVQLIGIQRWLRDVGQQASPIVLHRRVGGELAALALGGPTRRPPWWMRLEAHLGLRPGSVDEQRQ
jgi:hypothetical protein